MTIFFRPLKSRYKTLNHLKESKPEIGVFYAILQLYLYTVMEYSSSILSSVLTPTREGNFVDYIFKEYSWEVVGKNADCFRRTLLKIFFTVFVS